MARTGREYYQTKELNTGSEGPIYVKDTRDKESPDDKPNQAKVVQEAEDQYDAAEGGNFKDIRKAINLSDNPSQKQRLQNKLDKLELKKGFKAEKKKQKGLESITKKEFKPKYKEYTRAKLEKEAEGLERESKTKDQFPGLDRVLHLKDITKKDEDTGEDVVVVPGADPSSSKYLRPSQEPAAIKTGKISSKQMKSHMKMSEIAKNLGGLLNR